MTSLLQLSRRRRRVNVSGNRMASMMLSNVILPLTVPAPVSTGCDTRLAKLRAHVDAAEFDEAMQLSAMLKRTGTLPTSCMEDVPYEGPVDVLSYSDGTLQVRLKDDPGRPGLYDVYTTEAWTLLTAPAVSARGFTLDGHFVMVWHADVHPNIQGPGGLRMAPGSARQRVADYTLGTKKMLIIPVCGQDMTEAECTATLSTHMISTTYAGDVVQYLHDVVDFSNEWLANASYGQFGFEPTILPPMRVTGYNFASCGTYNVVGWTPWAPDPVAVDTLAFAQMELEYGLSRSNFDFAAVVLAKCPDIKWSGRGWVGIPGFALNMVSSSLDPSFLHEFGHNVGMNHGARLRQGSRGRAIWETGFIETYSSSPTGGMVEYGSDVTPMGRGNTPDGHFVLPSKIILDWVSDADTVQIPLGVSCSPCGPYLLQPIDTGARVAGTPIGLRIQTPVQSRYFWIEHRTKVSSGSAIVITSAAYKPDHADGGVVSKSVMVDKLLEGTAADAYIFPTQTVELDVGEQGNPTPMHVDVTRLIGGLLEVSLRTVAVVPTPSSPPSSP
eukprot:scaffold29774_cov112-Isochrysis_galbana.AAC.1